MAYSYFQKGYDPINLTENIKVYKVYPNYLACNHKDISSPEVPGQILSYVRHPHTYSAKVNLNQRFHLAYSLNGHFQSIISKLVSKQLHYYFHGLIHCSSH